MPKIEATFEENKAIYSVSRIDRAARAVEQTRIANKSWADRRKELHSIAQARVAHNNPSSAKRVWHRETYRLSRAEARDLARNFFLKYPKVIYSSEVENWRVLGGDMIEFTVRRRPTAG